MPEVGGERRFGRRGVETRLTTTPKTRETSTPGAAEWTNSGPHPGQGNTPLCQTKTAATPPTMAARGALPG